jgi:hypothetical protein
MNGMEPKIRTDVTKISLQLLTTNPGTAPSPSDLEEFNSLIAVGRSALVTGNER